MKCRGRWARSKRVAPTRLAFLPVPLVLVLACDASARADVIGVSPSCPPWQDRVVVGHHGATACVDRVCRADGECSGGHCYNPTLVCVSGDRVLGPCEAGARCAEGACVTRGHCGP